MNRQRLKRWLRSIDPYLVYAFVGVVIYVLLINLLAARVAVSLRDHGKEKVSAPDARRAAAVISNETSLNRWPVAPFAETPMIQETMVYVAASLSAMLPFLADLPEARLAAWDLAMLTGIDSDFIQNATRLREEAEKAVGIATTAARPEALVAVREALKSAAVVWSIKGKIAEVKEVRNIIENTPARLAPTVRWNASSWLAFSGDVWGRATAGWSWLTPNGIVSVRDTLLKIRESHWRLDQRFAAVPPLYNSHLLPLRAGTYDAVVPFTRLLLHMWVLGGQREADKDLVEAYDAAVEFIIQDLIYTRTVRDEARAINITFVGSRAEALVPLATPRMCALSGLLAQGIRHGAHRYPGRPSTARYTENGILQAAEALAASCMQLYADPAGGKLRSAMYVTGSGHVPGYTRGEKLKDASLRSSYCDLPAVLLDSFYELYQTTHDSMYGLWATLVMRHGTSDHCGLRQADLTCATPWLRHIRELRSLWLLFHLMDCLVNRRSRGSRRVCDLANLTIMSPFTGHLVPILGLLATG